MKAPSRSEDRKKAIAWGGFAVLFAAIVYFELRDPNPPAAVPRPDAMGTAPAVARPVGAASSAGGVSKMPPNAAAALDPALHMDAMLVTEAVEYEGTGRNIFSATSTPPVVALPIAPARPAAKPVEPPRPLPCPPNCPPPPPPPPIPLKFFGLVTRADGTRQAFLLHDDDVFPAVPGDIVLRRYRVVSMSANSLEVEDMTNGNKQTLPLQVN